MKIMFSYNQICQIQLATVRRQEVYDLVRSYLGVPQGKLFDNYDLLGVLNGDEFTKYFNGTAECISVRGVEIDLPVCIHAIRTLNALQNIQQCLNTLDIRDPGSLTLLRRNVKHAKTMIDGVEW